MATAFRSIATAIPEHRLETAEALRHLREFWPRLAKLAEDEASLGARYTCEPIEQLLKPRSLTALRASYLQHAGRLAESAANKALEGAGVRGADVDLVITVSCTGYVVPSLDVQLSGPLGFRPDVLRLPITELGCSGGSAAIAAAQRHLVAYPDDHVLIVAVEVPSLSFQPDDQSVDNLTACLVFGDGAGAAVLARPDRRATHLQVVRAASHLIPGTADILGFDLRDSGFHVVLDRRLPRVLARDLKPVVDRFLAAGEMRPPSFYAVHAAGPRIFNAFESSLELPPDALAISRQVFADVGNASSAAIFFVLDRLIGSPPVQATTGLGLGVGPGVSLELMELAWVPAEVDAPAAVMTGASASI